MEEAVCGPGLRAPESVGFPRLCSRGGGHSDGGVVAEHRLSPDLQLLSSFVPGPLCLSVRREAKLHYSLWLPPVSQLQP